MRGGHLATLVAPYIAGIREKIADDFRMTNPGLLGAWRVREVKRSTLKRKKERAPF